MPLAPEIFLSYSREDQPTVRRYAEALEREGFSVWWDSALNPGETFDQVTEQALKDARAVIVLWSKHSVASRWVRSEATQADRFGTLVPVTIEPCDRPILFELTHTAELSGWNGDRNDVRWRDFVVGLKRLIGKGGPALTVAPSPAASASLPSPQRRRSMLPWASLAALVIVGAGLLWHFQLRGDGAQRKPAGNAATATPASVAVLPFRDMSQNKDQEYFADGVTEEILNSLSRVRDLTVTARTSSFAFKGKDISLREVGQALGVNHILEGSIRKDGDQLRITAQLIDTQRDAHLWSRTWDRPLQEVFKVQEEIAKAVADTLQVSLGVGEISRIPGTTRNVDAYDEFLAGAKIYTFGTPDSLQQAIEHMQRATQIDPDFASAWMRLSDFYLTASAMLPGQPVQYWQQKSKQASAEARRLAPDAFYVIYGDITDAIRQGKWNEAEELYDKLEAAAARQYAPFDVSGDRIAFLMYVGRAQEALVQQQQYRSRNPLEPFVALLLGEAYADTGNLPAALAELDRGLALQDTVRIRGTALVTALATGDRKQIEPRLIAMVGASGPGIDVHAAMQPLLDDPAKALVELRRLSAGSPGPQVQSTIGAWAAYFGDEELALEMLRTQVPRRNAGEVLRFWRPVMKDVRRERGFKDIVREIGLVDYWREFGWGDFCKPVGEADFECR